MGISFLKPKAQPTLQRNQELVPEYTANIFDKISFGWIYPLLKVSRASSQVMRLILSFYKTGYTRPLEENDVWHFDDDRMTRNVTNHLERNFYDRCPPSRRPLIYGGSGYSSAAVVAVSQGGIAVAEKGTTQTGQRGDFVDGTNGKDFPRAVKEVPATKEDSSTILGEATDSKVPPSYKTTTCQRVLSRLDPWSTLRKEAKVAQGKLHYGMDEHGRYRYYDSSLVIALLQTTWRPLLLATFYKGTRTVIEMTSSLVVKQLIAFITTSHAWARATEDERFARSLKVPKPLGHGIGLAIGLALMQQIALLCGNHYHLKSYGCGA